MTAVTGSIEGQGSESDRVLRRTVSPDEARRASRTWWDSEADDYQAEHGAFLGSDRWIWGPEGLDEADVGLLGSVSGLRVLEVGCGAAAGARWLRSQGAKVVGVDLSLRQLQHSQRLDAELATAVPTVCADVGALPFADGVFDAAGSAYGALPFTAETHAVMHEVARVLRPGAAWVFSVTHPIRWAFPDDPGPGGLVAERSYFDRRSYVEQNEQGIATYVEQHRTIGDWVDAVVGAGFVVERIVEPEWPESNTETWGAWSPLRGRVLPGTALFCCRKSKIKTEQL